MSGTYTAFLQSLLPSRFRKSGPNLSAILGAAGAQLDNIDPAQTQLANQFSVSGSTGAYLDLNGADWSTPRYAGESDSAYRARILSVLPTYAQGPTVNALSAAVQPFTGVAPVIFKGGSYTNLFPISFPLTLGAQSSADDFRLDVHIQNPDGVVYNRQAVQNAVLNTKRVIAKIVIWWEDGTNTTVI